jgi:hypothetical protein
MHERDQRTGEAVLYEIPTSQQILERTVPKSILQEVCMKGIARTELRATRPKARTFEKENILRIGRS